MFTMCIYIDYSFIYKRPLTTVFLTHNYIYSGHLDIFYVLMEQGYKKQNCEIFLNWLLASRD